MLDSPASLATLNPRKLAAEFVGTFLLVLLAVGSAVAGLKSSGVLAVAVAFGFVLIVAVYAFGPVSNCHINPAVTLGMVLSRRMPIADAAGYWVAQLAGAIVGAALLKWFVSSAGVKDETGNLGSNGYGVHISQSGAFVLEVVITAAFVLIILLVTDRVASPGMAGLAIGTALTAIHAFAIPLDGTSVNPARSFGPALLAGGEAWSQVWLFIVAPLIGAAVAVGVHMFTQAPEAA
jgi:aquaporin Z